MFKLFENLVDIGDWFNVLDVFIVYYWVIVVFGIGQVFDKYFDLFILDVWVFVVFFC